MTDFPADHRSKGSLWLLQQSVGAIAVNATSASSGKNHLFRPSLLSQAITVEIFRCKQALDLQAIRSAAKPLQSRRPGPLVAMWPNSESRFTRRRIPPADDLHLRHGDAGFLRLLTRLVVQAARLPARPVS